MSPYSISFTSQKGGSAADLQKRLGSATACVHGATTGCELEVGLSLGRQLAIVSDQIEGPKWSMH